MGALRGCFAPQPLNSTMAEPRAKSRPMCIDRLLSVALTLHETDGGEWLARGVSMWSPEIASPMAAPP